MNENTNAKDILQNIINFAQALRGDGVIYFSGDPLLAKQNRKAILISDINDIKEQISNLEKMLS